MNLYRSLGHVWTGTQADAKAANNGDKDFEHIEVPVDKAGLLQFLNELQPKPLSDNASDASDASDAPYRNGDPSFIFNKSRNPEAIFNCTNCGHQNRNLTT